MKFNMEGFGYYIKKEFCLTNHCLVAVIELN